MTRRLDEDGLVAWIRERAGTPGGRFVVEGIGDDCAICRPGPGEDLVVTTDLLVEDRHFRLATTSPEDLGGKVAAVNLSDIAAMGGRPRAVFLAAAFPAGRQAWVLAVLDGLLAMLARHEAPLAGGDLSASGAVTFCATVVGTVPQGTALTRRGGRPGDVLVLTGRPGLAGAGLRLLDDGWRSPAEGVFHSPDGRPAALPPGDARAVALRRHLCPEPRLAAGGLLRESGVVTAALDTSDGIARDLARVCAASGVGAVLDGPALDAWVQPGVVGLADILGGGEDYEILAAVDPGGMAGLEARWAGRPDLPPLRRIGRLVPPRLVAVTIQRRDREEPLPVAGFDHFASR